MILNTLIIALIVLSLAACMFAFYAKSGRPVRNFFLGSLTGLLALVFVNYVLAPAGLPFEANYFTVSCSLILGVPGVATMITMYYIL